MRRAWRIGAATVVIAVVSLAITGFLFRVLSLGDFMPILDHETLGFFGVKSQEELADFELLVVWMLCFAMLTVVTIAVSFIQRSDKEQ